ncbi:hypothetical protein GWK47_047435 [Chionoecetes opilio]|uniref:Uncharacterized protein n=1 Tax=Chionoecetes opilio TaxID=41210 RepID=A0A8J4YBZ5_CHIOP|nr:hypothetical protein GWK47_047435 [Chionoecetes opilio]
MVELASFFPHFHKVESPIVYKVIFCFDYLEHIQAGRAVAEGYYLLTALSQPMGDQTHSMTSEPVTIVPVKILPRLAFREGYLLKSDYEADGENIPEVRLQKGWAARSRKVFDLSAPRLPKHYSRPLAFIKEKVRDLQYLLDLMPVNKQTFYNNIIDAHTVGLTEDVPPDEDPDDLDEPLEYGSRPGGWGGRVEGRERGGGN